MTLHFLLLKVICQFFDQFCSLSKSACILSQSLTVETSLATFSIVRIHEHERRHRIWHIINIGLTHEQYRSQDRALWNPAQYRCPLRSSSSHHKSKTAWHSKTLNYCLQVGQSFIRVHIARSNSTQLAYFSRIWSGAMNRVWHYLFRYIYDIQYKSLSAISLVLISTTYFVIRTIDLHTTKMCKFIIYLR